MRGHKTNKTSKTTLNKEKPKIIETNIPELYESLLPLQCPRLIIRYTGDKKLLKQHQYHTTLPFSLVNEPEEQYGKT